MRGADAVAGSYRDPAGRIFRQANRIFRAIAPAALDDFKRVEESGLPEALVASGRLVPSHDLAPDAVAIDGFDVGRLLELEPLPFVTWPYEWCFDALREAALLHLDIHLEALERNCTLIDASAYNVQFDGGRAVFIDHLSFRPYRDGAFWTGQRQFSEQFLNPLLLQAYTGIPFNGWYRGAPEGITSADLAALLPFRAGLRPTVLTNVVLPAWFDRRRPDSGRVKRKLAASRLPKPAFQGMLGSLRRLIDGLRPGKGPTLWDDYATAHSYDTDAYRQKQAFVAEFCNAARPGTLWDMGCNTGDFARVSLAAGAGFVIGFDSDHGALMQAWKRRGDEGINFLPLYMDAANPTPSQGWNQAERAGLAERRNADAVLALALVHHLCIGRNLPLDQIVAWLVGLAPLGIIEFVPKDDPMVRELLSLREDIFVDYDVAAFEASLNRIARIEKQETVTDTGRRLYWFDRR